MASIEHKRAVIGSFFVKKTEYTISVFSGYKYPHFVINCMNFILLRIDKPAYWFTPEFDVFNTTLPPNAVQPLHAFLKAKSVENPSVTNWHQLVAAWNRLNPDHKVKVTSVIPDYSRARYDAAWVERFKARVKKYNEEKLAEWEKTLPKYEYACVNCRGGDLEVYNAMKTYARKGFRFVGGFQGADCCLPVVVMERPLYEFPEIEEPEENE